MSPTRKITSEATRSQSRSVQNRKASNVLLDRAKQRTGKVSGKLFVRDEENFEADPSGRARSADAANEKPFT
jgi:hypothetical protein